MARLAGSLKQLSADEWAAVEAGDFRVVIAAADGALAPVAVAKRQDPSPQVPQIVERLNQAADRAAAAQALAGKGITRDVLRSVARAAGVHTTAKDTKDALVQRIVESTIGFRLRALAIQGESQLPPAVPSCLAP